MIPLIKSIFADTTLLYKNLLHWNISKLIYSVYGLIVGLILAIIPLALFGVFLYFSYLDIGILASFLLDGDNSGEFMGSLLASPISSILAGLMLVVAAATVYFGIWYGNFFISWLSLKYIDGKKPKYFKKSRYINLAWIKKLAGIMGGLILITLGFIGVYIILFIILVLISGGISGVNETLLLGENNWFSMLTLFLTLLLLASFIYYGYRLSFSYLCFIDKKNTSKKALSYIKESFILTKGWSKFGRFVSIFILTAIILAPISFLDNHLESTRQDLPIYAQFIAAENKIGKQELTKQLLANDNSSYQQYMFLSIKYAGMTLDEISTKSKNYNIYNWIFNILYFLLIYGIYHMVFSSFYVRELKKK